MTVFREASTTQETAPQEVKPVELTDDGSHDTALSTEPELSVESELEKWEVQNGKYGHEYLGIKEISKEFPYNAQFSQLDKYIKAEMEERGYDKTPKAWQDILAEIEGEIGSSKLDAIKRLGKLTNYIKVLQKFKAAKKMKESFR